MLLPFVGAGKWLLDWSILMASASLNLAVESVESAMYGSNVALQIGEPSEQTCLAAWPEADVLDVRVGRGPRVGGVVLVSYIYLSPG